MRTLKILLLLLLFTGITTSTHAQETEMQPVPENTGKYNARRSPALAAGLSFITAGFGGGQYYNKEYWKAGVMSAISAGMIVWLISLNDGLDDLGEAIVASLVYLGNWAYSIIDAPISADIINKRHGLRKITLSPSFERNTWDARTINAGLKLTLSLD